MKANEIMLGDWLWYKGRFNAFHFQVEQITKYAVGFHAEPCECEMHYLRLCECNPIPLTPEILEKNGVEFNDFRCNFFKEDEDSVLEILKGKYIWWSINFAEYTILRLDYVHQLQHAIRLCGIKKEIIL